MTYKCPLAKSVITILLAHLLYACNSTTNDQTVVPVDIKSFTQLSILDLAKDIEQIPLELTENSMVGNIGKIEFTANAIFIHDFNSSRILAFDNNGKFLRQIGKKGEGPGEFNYFNSFAVDEDQDLIYVAAKGKLILYRLNGAFVKEVNTFNFINYLAFVKDELKIFSSYFGYQAQGSAQLYNLEILFTVNSANEKKDSVVVKKIPVKSPSGTVFPQAKYFSRSNDQYYFYLPVLIPENLIRDTLYSYSNNELSFYKKIDFESQVNPEAKRKSIKIKSIIKTDRYYISEFLKKGDFVFVYDIKEKEGFHMKKGIDVSDFILEKTASLFPILNESNAVYFVGKPLESANDSDEPNASIFKVKLK